MPIVNRTCSSRSLLVYRNTCIFLSPNLFQWLLTYHLFHVCLCKLYFILGAYSSPCYFNRIVKRKSSLFLLKCRFSQLLAEILAGSQSKITSITPLSMTSKMADMGFQCFHSPFWCESFLLRVLDCIWSGFVLSLDSFERCMCGFGSRKTVLVMIESLRFQGPVVN